MPQKGVEPFIYLTIRIHFKSSYACLTFTLIVISSQGNDITLVYCKVYMHGANGDVDGKGVLAKP